jgi:predicted dehydrogenase
VAAPRAAVIGAGWIAEHCHLPGYRRAGVEVAAVADLVEERAAAMAAAFGARAVYADWREMLREEKPDLVSVCLPNVFHHEAVMAALAAGAHVLCEKPLATSLAQAEEMFEAARKRRLLLMAEQNVRFRKANQVIKERLAAGELGEVYHAEAVYIRRLGIPNWGSFTMKRFSAGGALLDIGVHVVDLALWFMDNPRPVTVSAQTEMRFGRRPEIAAARHGAWNPDLFDVEDFATAFVRFQGGATLYLQTSWASHIEQSREYVRLLGTEAGVVNDPPAFYRLREGRPEDEPLDIPRMSGWLESVQHFVDAAAGRVECAVKPEETLNAQRILDAAYASAARGREVEVER